MTQVVSALKGDAARVFDWVCHNLHKTGDLGLVLLKMWNHYSATLTFREQRNDVENLRQASGEDAIDFLIHVSDAIQTLGNVWKGLITSEELETLQYEVCLNGVKEDIRHVLDTEAAKFRELNSDQMYDALKHHEAYVARNKQLQGKVPHPGPVRAAQLANAGYRPRFQKTNAFSAVTVEPPNPMPENAVEELEEGLVEIEPASDEPGGS